MEEIKAGDIMLGNYIQSPYGNYPIAEIGYKDDDAYIRQKDCHAGYYLSYCRPIPLTEYILLKAGATPYRAKDIFILGDIIIDIKLGIAMLNYIDCTPLLCKCKHLHTFQNIVKLLTGNDLKIEV